MKQHIVTEVVTYKASNRKGEEIANFALQLKYRIIKGERPVFDILRAIEDHCRFLDHKYPNTRKLEVELHRASISNEQNVIYVYSGDKTKMTAQPKAAVIYMAELAGVIDTDSLEAGTIDFGQETTETISRKEEQS